MMNLRYRLAISRFVGDHNRMQNCKNVVSHGDCQHTPNSDWASSKRGKDSCLAWAEQCFRDSQHSCANLLTYFDIRGKISSAPGGSAAKFHPPLLCLLFLLRNRDLKSSPQKKQPKSQFVKVFAKSQSQNLQNHNFRCPRGKISSAPGGVRR